MAQKHKRKVSSKIIRFFSNMFSLGTENEEECLFIIPVEEEFERCVLCRKLTSIPITMPIDFRDNYEIGLGQICSECAKKLYKEETRENRILYKKILTAVECSRKTKRK